MDLNDPWDVWVAESVGKPIVQHVHRDGRSFHRRGYDKQNINTWYDVACAYLGGRQYEDGFGAFSPLDPTPICIVEKPRRLFLPEGLEPFLKGRFGMQIDMCLIGQADGPGTPDSVWAVRLWNSRENCESRGSRFISDRLSWAMSALAFRVYADIMLPE